MNTAHPRATVAPASARAEVRLTYSDSPCAGVAAPAPSIPDHVAMLAALCDKSLLCATRYEEISRWLPSWSVGRVYRVLHGLEAQGLVLRSALGWRAGDAALVRLREYEARTQVRAVVVVQAGIAAAEAAAKADRGARS